MPVASGSIAFLGAARFQGYWDATSNHATGSGADSAVTGEVQGLFATGSSTAGGYALVASQKLTASAGDYWQVTGSGTHNVDGNTSWNLNDWCVYSGSAGVAGSWIRLAFEDTIASIIVGDMSSLTTFHMGGDTDKDVIFSSGSVLSGTKNFTFNYESNNLLLTGGLNISDNNKIFFGAAGDASIEYDEDGTDELRFAGAAATFEQAVSFDANVTLGNADTDVVTVTGQLTGSEGAVFNSHVVCNANVTLGNADTDVVTVTGQLTGSEGLSVPDNIKIRFGNATDGDAHMHYDEGGDDYLIISGSDQGVTLMGSVIEADGHLDVKDKIRRKDDSDNYINFGASQFDFYLHGMTPMGISTSATGTGSINLNAHGKDVDVTLLSNLEDAVTGDRYAVYISGSDGIINSNYGVHLADDKKISLGDNNDAHLEYNEDGDNLLIISGSAAGMVLSGTHVAIDGRLIGAEDEDTYVDLSLTTNDQINLVAGGNTLATLYGAGAKNVSINPLSEDVDFKVNQDAGTALFMSGSDGILHSHYGIIVKEDKKAVFGADTMGGHIEFNEDGDNLLIISGSAKGVALSGSVVAVDGLLDVSRIRNINVSNNYIDFGANQYDMYINGFRPLAIAQLSNGTGSIQFNGNGKDVDFTIMSNLEDAVAGDTYSLYISGSDGIINSNYGIHLADDKKISFGDSNDAHIEFNEDGDNYLIISGSDQGIVLSGSTIQIAGTLEGASPLRIAGSVEFLDATETTISGNLNIADDQKLYLGASGDAHLEYNENGDDLLIISGSSQGMVLSGSVVSVVGHLDASRVRRIEDSDNYIDFNTSQTDFYVNAFRTLSLAQVATTGTGSISFNGHGKDVDFTIMSNLEDAVDGDTYSLYISGSDGIINSNYGVHLADDTKISFGDANDAHIEFNENGDNLLIISGSSQGMVLSGSTVTIDGLLVGAGIASGSLSGPGSYVGVNDAGQLVLTASSGGTGTVTISNDGDNRLVTAAGDGSVNGEANLTFDGSDLFITGNINLADDKKIYLGAAGDAHIEFNENGDNLLIISGSGQGMVLSGSTITLDGIVAGPGVASGSISGPGSFLALNDSGQFVLGTPTGGSVTIANDGDNRIATANGNGTLSAEANLVFNGTTLSVSGSVSVSGSLEPDGDAIHDLGSPTHRWANVYTGDLHLKNDRGDWTIVEEEDYLTIINNKKDKRYKFVLEEID